MLIGENGAAMVASDGDSLVSAIIEHRHLVVTHTDRLQQCMTQPYRVNN